MRYFFQPLSDLKRTAVDDAVVAAVASAGPLPTGTAVEEETPEIPTGEVETPETVTDGDLDEFGLTKAQQIEGRQLLAGLKDPAKAGKIIDFLATQAGYKKGEIETKADVKEATKDLVAELKEALGPELAYLAEKMGPVFEKRFKADLEESQKDIRQKLDEAATEKSTAAADSAQAKISTEYFGGKGIPTDLSKEMESVIGTLPFTGNMDSYLRDVLFVAAGRKGVVLTKTGTTAPKPRDTTMDRLNSQARQQPRIGETATQPARQMTIDDAVRSALEQVKTEAAKK